MISSKKNKIYLEIISICIIVLIIDLYFIEYPGFYNLNYIIYWTIPLVFTLYYGKKWILISLFSTLLTLSISFIITFQLFSEAEGRLQLSYYLQNLPVSLSLSILLLFLSTLLLTRYTYTIDKLNKRVKKLSLESLHYRRSTAALERVNTEFESQLSRSQDSITALYNQIEMLSKLNSKYVLQTFLETIVQFTKTRKATVWEFDEINTRLNLTFSIGYENNEPGPYLDINSTVEGYVYRNNQFFSIRKIGDFQSISIKHSQYNIMTIPINIGRRVWGVLNIEDIPFEKYSRYSEQLIKIIVNLAEPALEKALEYENMVKYQDLDNATGIPLYTQFYTLLDDKLNSCWKKGSSVSVIIFDVLNLSELCELSSFNDLIKLFTDTLSSVFIDGSHDFLLFRYKEANQISLLSTNLDQDGISYYLVKVFKIFSTMELFLEDQKISFELAVGYSTQKESKLTTDSILLQAENLLNMSKY